MQARTGCLAQAVAAGAEEIEEAEVAEDLELLADFVADVGVFGVEAGERAGVGVDVGEGEFGFVEGADGVQDVEGPAAFFDGDLFEGAEALAGKVALANSAIVILAAKLLYRYLELRRIGLIGALNDHFGNSRSISVSNHLAAVGSLVANNEDKKSLIPKGGRAC
jgi:hypothetical protein